MNASQPSSTVRSGPNPEQRRSATQAPRPRAGRGRARRATEARVSPDLAEPITLERVRWVIARFRAIVQDAKAQARARATPTPSPEFPPQPEGSTDPAKETPTAKTGSPQRAQGSPQLVQETLMASGLGEWLTNIRELGPAATAATSAAGPSRPPVGGARRGE